MTTPDGGGGPGDEPGYPNERYSGFGPGDDTGDYPQHLGGAAPGGARGWQHGGAEDVGVDDLMSYGDSDLPDQRRPRRGWKVPTTARGRDRPRAEGYPDGARSTRPTSGQRPPTQAGGAGGPASNSFCVAAVNSAMLLARVEPRITNRNPKVMTNSVTKAAVRA